METYRVSKVFKEEHARGDDMWKIERTCAIALGNPRSLQRNEFYIGCNLAGSRIGTISCSTILPNQLDHHYRGILLEIQSQNGHSVEHAVWQLLLHSKIKAAWFA